MNVKINSQQVCIMQRFAKKQIVEVLKETEKRAEVALGITDFNAMIRQLEKMFDYMNENLSMWLEIIEQTEDEKA